jgi:hypothetical protein
MAPPGNPSHYIGGRMDVDKLSSLGSRLCFAAAFILFAGGVAEWVLLMLRVRIDTGYKPGRLVEFSAMLLVPVVTVLLREIREELRKPKNG